MLQTLRGAAQSFWAPQRRPEAEEFRMEPITAPNFHLMWNYLLPLQAEEHETAIKGSRADCYSALLSPDPAQRILEGFILYKNGKPAGYALTSEMDGPEGRTIYLEDCLIVEEFQGNGFGKRIFDLLKIEAIAKGADFIACTVDPTRPKASRFYQKIGMTRDSHPLLGMGDFHIMNSAAAPGAAIILRGNDVAEGRLEAHAGEGGLTASKSELDAMRIPSLVIPDAAIEPDRVRLLEESDIGALLEATFHDGEKELDRHKLIGALKSVMSHPRNAVSVYTDRHGSIRSLAFASTTYSTFNNYSRKNMGDIVCVNGPAPGARDVLAHTAFWKGRTDGGRLELRLNAALAALPALSGLYNMCVSKMTDEVPDSSEYGWRIRVADVADKVVSLPRSVIRTVSDALGTGTARKRVAAQYPAFRIAA